MRFHGRSIVVTGGLRGIGKAICDRFVAEGAQVFVLDSGRSEAEEPSGPGSWKHLPGSVADAADVERCLGQVVAAAGRVDVLVNNAGIIRDNVIWKMSEQEFDAVLQVNLKGPWLMCRQVAPLMRQQQGGRIVNIASRSWLGNFGQSNYSSSKGGLISLTRVLALELARYNVTVNAVAPGLIDTPMTQGMPAEALEKLIAAQPGKKAGRPEDIAAAVAFLASSEAGFITGQVLHVDGGRSVGSTVF
jgi:NAD(P)-dependent dehydrogenase (short-subunit alcohol dehydrogenase family)